MKKLTDTTFGPETKNRSVYSVVLWTVVTHPKSIEVFDYLKGVEKISNPQSIQFCYVDIDLFPEIAMRYSVREVPFITVHDPEGWIVSAGAPNAVDLDTLKTIMGDKQYEVFFPRIPSGQ
jgi:hypothetical protein